MKSEMELDYDDKEYFTVVFIGDVRKLEFNPMKAKTIFGEVAGVSIGDLMEKVRHLEFQLEDAGQE